MKVTPRPLPFSGIMAAGRTLETMTGEEAKVALQRLLINFEDVHRALESGMTENSVWQAFTARSNELLELIKERAIADDVFAVLELHEAETAEFRAAISQAGYVHIAEVFDQLNKRLEKVRKESPLSKEVVEGEVVN